MPVDQETSKKCGNFGECGDSGEFGGIRSSAEPFLKKVTDEYWESLRRPKGGSVFGRWMNNLKRDHITPQLKKKGMRWNGWHAFRRGLATNLHEMGVPTKVIQRICRHADEATTKKHYIRATDPGVRRGLRKLEALITREKHERRGEFVASNH